MASTTIMMIMLLLSSSSAVVEARELSLYRADDGDAGTTASNHHKTSTTTITLKRRVVRQPQPRHQRAAEEAPTTGKTSIAATTSTSTTEDSDRTLLLENERNIAEARDMSEGSTMLADEVVEQEAVEEERLHRERREMFLRNLRLDAGGGTGLMSTSVRPSIDLSMDTSSPFEPTRHGVNPGGDDADSPSGGVPDDKDKEAVEKCPPPAIDLTALRKEAYDYELQEEGKGNTKSGEQQPEMPPTIDLFDLRKKAVEHYELQKTLLVHEPTFSSQGKIEETNSGEQMVSSSIDLLDLRMKAKDFEGLGGLQRNLGRTDTYLRNRFPQAIKQG
jgi:hypothetical protein